jgi:hypothetical protein
MLYYGIRTDGATDGQKKGLDKRRKLCYTYFASRAILPTTEDSSVQNKTGKFTFAIPDGHPQAGEKVEKSFDYKVCDNDTEASAVIAEKKWSIVGMVNDVLKANARSNAYQAALLPYRPSEVSPEEIKERMVRDYIRLGIAEDVARKQVEALLAASATA